MIRLLKVFQPPYPKKKKDIRLSISPTQHFVGTSTIYRSGYCCAVPNVAVSYPFRSKNSRNLASSSVIVSYSPTSTSYFRSLRKKHKKRVAYLLDLRQKEKRQHRAKDTQRAGDEERVLAGANRIWRILLRNGNHIRAHKGPNLPRGRCNRVVLSADRSRAALCRAESDVVAGAEFT